MKYALVDGGVVRDLLESDFHPGEPWIPVFADMQIGGILDADNRDPLPQLIRWGLPVANIISAIRDATSAPGDAWVMLPFGAQTGWTREDAGQPWGPPVFRYALHANNIVQNIALAAEALAPNWARVSGQVSMGWWRTDEDASWMPPVPLEEPVPVSCTRRQGQLALLSSGLLDAIEAAIAAIDDPQGRRQAQIEYGADVWQRGNAFLSQLWAHIGGTPDSLDDAFRLAVKL